MHAVTPRIEVCARASRTDRHQRQNGIKFHRAISVWCRHEQAAPRYPLQLPQEFCRIGPTADGLQHGAGMHMVECAIRERQIAAVGFYKSLARIKPFQKRCAIDYNCGGTMLMRIPRLKIVRISVALVASGQSGEPGNSRKMHCSVRDDRRRVSRWTGRCRLLFEMNLLASHLVYIGLYQ